MAFITNHDNGRRMKVECMHALQQPKDAPIHASIVEEKLYAKGPRALADTQIILTAQILITECVSCLLQRTMLLLVTTFVRVHSVA